MECKVTMPNNILTKRKRAHAFQTEAGVSKPGEVYRQCNTPPRQLYSLQVKWHVYRTLLVITRFTIIDNKQLADDTGSLQYLHTSELSSWAVQLVTMTFKHIWKTDNSPGTN